MYVDVFVYSREGLNRASDTHTHLWGVHGSTVITPSSNKHYQRTHSTPTLIITKSTSYNNQRLTRTNCCVWCVTSIQTLQWVRQTYRLRRALKRINTYSRVCMCANFEAYNEVIVALEWVQTYILWTHLHKGDTILVCVCMHTHLKLLMILDVPAHRLQASSP